MLRLFSVQDGLYHARMGRRMAINIWAVLLAAAVSIAIGTLWYSRAMFGENWRRHLGNAVDDDGNPVPSYGWMAVGAFTAAMVLAVFMQATRMTSPFGGILTALLIVAGFMAPALGSEYLFTRRPSGLYFLNLARHGVTFLIMGIILGVWT
jgi:hypothetical protein